jgi:hypothetical protein
LSQAQRQLRRRLGSRLTDHSLNSMRKIFKNAFKLATGIDASKIRIASICSGSTIVRIEGEHEELVDILQKIRFSQRIQNQLALHTGMRKIAWEIDGTRYELTIGERTDVVEHPVSESRVAVSVPNPRKFAALDTDFMLGLAAGDEDHEEAVEWLSQHAYFGMVTGTVMQELADMEANDLRFGPMAREALKQIATWGLYTTPLTYDDIGVIEVIAEQLLATELGNNLTKNDGLVIAEAAYNGCTLLITNRPSLHAADREKVRVLLLGGDVTDVMVTSPQQLIVAK